MANPASLVISLGCIFLMKYINFDDPEHCYWVRVFYVCAISICALLLLLLKFKISKMEYDPNKKIKVVAQGQEPQMLNFLEHDMQELRKLGMENVFMSALISFGLDRYGYVQPLFFQAAMCMPNVLSSKLSQIHFFEYPAEGALERPWKVDNPLAAFFEPPAEESEATEDLTTTEVDDSTPKITEIDDDSVEEVAPKTEHDKKND